MIKVFIDQPLSVGKLFKIDGANHHHLRVVKIRKGDTILVGDNNFNEFGAEVIEVEKRNYELKVENRRTSLKAPIRNVDMYISIPKKRKFEDIIYKCTQLGVNRFVPILSARTEKRIRDNNYDKICKRWENKARYGAELSARQTLPNIDCIMNFEEALKDFSSAKFKSGIFFWEEKGAESYVRSEDLASKMAIFIGPEGGFQSDEAAQAEEGGLKIRSLGKLVMDVETASISAAALLLATP